ncbi:hypothetical protein N0A02_30440 [Paraburkholderia acidicola]|uniref:Uncharacterized protein n=1 Tax=Paraburkholderia acidicola TaxID=1912599 RepID=A0ABV1LXX5_9BURK
MFRIANSIACTTKVVAIIMQRNSSGKHLSCKAERPNPLSEVTGANVLAAIFGEKDSRAVYFLRQEGVKLSAW